MADLQILHQEPRHKVEEFVDELLVRARQVIAAMGPTFERLLQDMIGQFRAFREAHYLIILKDVRFERTRWVREGQLVIEFSAEPNLGREPDASELRHAVIDEFVDGVVQRWVPEELRSEFSGFVRGMVMQFSLIKKWEPTFDLGQINLSDITWLTDRQLAIRMTYRGRPFTPRQVRM